MQGSAWVNPRKNESCSFSAHFQALLVNSAMEKVAVILRVIVSTARWRLQQLQDR